MIMKVKRAPTVDDRIPASPYIHIEELYCQNSYIVGLWGLCGISRINSRTQAKRVSNGDTLHGELK